MNRYFRNVLIFFFLFGISFSLVFLGLRSIELSTNEDIKKSEIAIIGHSHVEFSVNDSLLSKRLGLNFVNYGRGGQSLFWSLISAKKLRHQGVKDFVILLTNNSYTTGWKTFDSKRGKRETYLKNFMSANDFIYLFESDFLFTSQNFFHFDWPTRHIHGQYSKGKRKFEPRITKANLRQIVDFDDELLHKFITENPNLRIVLLRAPLHPDYYNIIQSEKLEGSFLHRLKKFEQYKNVLILDYGHLLNKNRFFMDYGHLNEIGSFELTSVMSDTLENIHFFNSSK